MRRDPVGMEQAEGAGGGAVQPGSFISAVGVGMWWTEKQSHQTCGWRMHSPFCACHLSPAGWSGEAAPLISCQACVFLPLHLAATNFFAVQNKWGAEVALSVQHPAGSYAKNAVHVVS